MRHGGRIDTLDNLIQVTIEIDDMLYERAMEKRGHGGFRGSGITPRGGRNGQRDPYGHILIELDTTITRRPRGKPRGKPIKKSSDFSYYAYRKKGYIARDYYLKNKVQ